MAHHLHIEGMDLSGKTSLATQYIERSNDEWQINHGLLNEDNPIRSLADQLAATKRYSSKIIDELYIAGIAADIESHTRPTINTLQDSVIALRALTWHIVNNNKESAKKIEALLVRHPKFDHSFYLATDIKRRQERLAIRERDDPQKVNSKDLLVREDPDRFRRMENYLQRYALDLFGAHIIDTTNLTPEEVFLQMNSYVVEIH